MSFAGVCTEETASIIDFLAPFVDLRSSERKKKPELQNLPDWIENCVSIFSLSCLHESRNSDNFLWIWTILKTRWLDVPILLNFSKQKVNIHSRQQWTCAMGFFSLECTSLSIFRFSALVCWLKSLHANLYMQNTVHDSLSYARSCVLKGNRPEKTTKNTLKFFFGLQQLISLFSPFCCFFSWTHLIFRNSRLFFLANKVPALNEEIFPLILIKLEQQFHYLRSTEDYLSASSSFKKRWMWTKRWPVFLLFSTR